MEASARTSLLRRTARAANESSGDRNLGFEGATLGVEGGGFFDWESLSRAEESMLTFDRRREMAYTASGEREEPLPPIVTTAVLSERGDAMGAIWRARERRQWGKKFACW